MNASEDMRNGNDSYPLGIQHNITVTYLYMENHAKKMLQVNHRTKWAMASFFAMPKIQWVDSRILLGPWPMSRKTPPFDHPRLAGQSDWIHPEVILGDVPHQKIGLSSGYPLKLYIYIYIYII
jgi:hypothetical protein